MAKTSIKDYVEAGIVGSCIIAVIVLVYVMVAPSYEITDIDTSSLSVYGNFSQMVANANESSSKVYDLNAETGLFDILGDLVVKGLAVVKTFISGIKFMTFNVNNLLSSKVFYIPTPIIIAVITIITLTIASVMLFRHISGKEDEK